MTKKRVTLTLDEEVLAAFAQEPNVSSAINAVLREYLEAHLHRRALRARLDELDAKYGPPTPEALAAADAVLDEAEALAGRPARDARAARRKDGAA